MKKCRACNLEKTLDNFSPNGKSGLYSRCKTCASNKVKAHWKNNPDSYQKYRRSKGYAEAKRKSEKKRRAHKQGSRSIPFTAAQLSARMSYWGNKCWICSGPFEQIDHVKPLSAGGLHCLSNLRPICAAHNNRKRNCWPFLADDIDRILQS